MAANESEEDRNPAVNVHIPLIEAVRQKPSLYDKSNFTYNVDSKKNSRLWAEVAAAVKIADGPAAFKAFKSLRDQVRRVYNTTPSGSGADEIKRKPAIYEHMKWLIPHFQERSGHTSTLTLNTHNTPTKETTEFTQAPISDEHSGFTDFPMESNDTDFFPAGPLTNAQTTPGTTQAARIVPMTNRKRKLRSDNVSEFEKEILAVLKAPETVESTYGMYVSQRLAEFDEEKRKYLQYKISELFYKADFDPTFFPEMS